MIKPMILALRSRELPWGRMLVLITAAFGLAVYAYLNPIGGQVFLDLRGLLPLSGDLPAYVLRFAAASALFCILPLGCAFLCGYKPRELGLSPDWRFLTSPVWWIILVAFTCSSVYTSLTDPQLGTFYPFSKTLGSLAKADFWWFLAHAALYLLLYYLPWEVLFRGIMVAMFIPGKNGYVELEGMDTLQAFKFAGIAACVQIFPSMLLHLPHPFLETLGTIPFGLTAAYLVLKHRSILPCLVLHGFVGVCVDASIIFLK